MRTLPASRAHGGRGLAGLGIESFAMSTPASSGIGTLARWGIAANQRLLARKICVRRLRPSGQHWNLIRRQRARRAWRRFACVAMEQFVQLGLLPECETRQKNA